MGTSNSVYHAKSAANKWGGEWELYLPVEEWIDSSKKIIGDIRHRAIYHHTLGVWLAQEVFGRVLEVKRDGGIVEVPVRLIAERHIEEDLGWIPSPADYLNGMPMQAWMSGKRMREEPLSRLGLVQTGEGA